MPVPLTHGDPWNADRTSRPEKPTVRTEKIGLISDIHADLAHPQIERKSWHHLTQGGSLNGTPARNAM